MSSFAMMTPLHALPPDHYGVLIVNDMDELRLRWLVARIGESKLRSSVAKYNHRYPDCKPYVSVLLNWYGLKVPVSVYAAVRVPIERVYMLVLADESAVKIGFSGHWPSRARSYLYATGSTVAEKFNLLESVSFAAMNRAAAIDAETAILEATVHWRRAPPRATKSSHRGVAWTAGGLSEWRVGAARAPILALLIEHAQGAPLMSLRDALAQEMMMECISDVSSRAPH